MVLTVLYRSCHRLIHCCCGMTANTRLHHVGWSGYATFSLFVCQHKHTEPRGEHHLRNHFGASHILAHIFKDILYIDKSNQNGITIEVPQP